MTPCFASRSAFTPWTETVARSAFCSPWSARPRCGMAAKRPGDTLDLVGPLGGKLFVPDARPGATHVMVGGGYGVPPLVFLSRELRQADPARANHLSHRRAPQGFAAVRGGTAGGGHRHAAQHGGRLVGCGGPGDGRADATPGREAGRPPDGLLLRADPDDAGRRGPVPGTRHSRASCPWKSGCRAASASAWPASMDLADGRRVRCCTDGPVFQAGEVAW